VCDHLFRCRGPVPGPHQPARFHDPRGADEFSAGLPVRADAHAILRLVGDLRSPGDIATATATATQRTRRHLRSAVRWSASASSERTGRIALSSRGLLHAHGVCAAQWGNPGSDDCGPRADAIITAITDGVRDRATLLRVVHDEVHPHPERDLAYTGFGELFRD